MPRNLFYSTTEKILFNVAGYTDNSTNVQDIIKVLEEGSDTLSEMSGEDKSKIKTHNIQKSSRYKHMRVFFVSTENCPKETFKLGEDWTMEQWLSN